MKSPFLISLLRSYLVVIMILISFKVVYAQDAKTEKELTEAINNFNNEKYEDAIPILKKYTEMKGIDDYKNLEINVYLNWCYLVTKNEALNVEKVNALADAYISKYSISENDSLRSEVEMELIFIVGKINSNIENNEKLIFFLSLLKNYYENSHLKWDKRYCETLIMLADVFYKTQNYDAAIELGQKAWNVNLEILGEMNDKSLKILDVLYSTCQERNDYNEKSLEYIQKYVEIAKKILGEKHPDYLMSLNNLATAYTTLGEYQKALEISLQDVELRKEVLGEKHPDYFSSLSNLSIIYYYLGNYEESLEVSLRLVELQKEVLGEKHPDYLSSMNVLAIIYSDNGDYKEALGIYLNVVELEKEALGENNEDYLTSLMRLASVYSSLGKYQMALEIKLKVVELGKYVWGEKHPDYLSSLGNLALEYSEIGDYQKALEIDLKVVELEKEVLGERNEAYLTSIGNLAMVYLHLGNYPKALGIQLKVVELRKEVLGENHADYLLSLANLASVYSELGDKPKAIALNLKVIELVKNLWGERHPYYIGASNNLVILYTELGDYQKALEIAEKITEYKKVSLGEKHPDYLLSLASLASVYSGLGEYQKALEIDIQVALTYKEVLGEKHPYYAKSLNNLAKVYSHLGDYQKALEFNEKVVILAVSIWGEKHPEYLSCLGNLVETEFYLSEYDSALTHYLQLLNLIEGRVNEYFSLMTEYQREKFWTPYIRYFTFLPLFFEKESDGQPERAGDAYNISLFSKGILLNTTLDFEKLIVGKGTPEAIAKYDELKILKFEIQRLSEKPIAERYLNVDSLENIAQQKETELVKLSKEYGDYTGNLKINWKDVQANLHDKDVAIEFVEYPTSTDTVKYAALVLRKGWQYPRMIPLFRKDQVVEFIKLDKDQIYSNNYVGKQIKKLLWNPLEEVIATGERVYFSPTGIIHQLAIENLPFDDSTTLGDRYQMYRLSSTKELALHKAESKSNIAALYGGLQYDLPEEKMMAESKKYEKPENLFAMRGYTNDTAVRSGWKFLDGTKPEVDKISQLLKGKHYQVDEYTGESGNEESFKSLSGKKEGIIHIATHGFFLPIEESRKNTFIMQRMGDQPQEKATVDPMLRSGLIMAGGNKAWQGEKIPDNIEDGVLTAKEISRMDLRGNDLVVLSACETGLGEVSSEGVFGLQRSFKQAGVQTLVMSLWQVNDEATRYLMTEFYSELLSGKDKRAAFLEAKQKCKKKYPEPRYWAAFIMLD
jgi:CHAT domain-containing protein/tetratricopeptide (TPR) repeat protein